MNAAETQYLRDMCACVRTKWLLDWQGIRVSRYSRPKREQLLNVGHVLDVRCTQEGRAATVRLNYDGFAIRY